MQIYSFTHGDVDGAVSNLLVQKYHNRPGVEFKVEFCNYRNIDNRVESFLDGKEYNESVFIVLTDIFPSPEIMRRLDNTANKKIAIDHHQTSQTELEKENYDWVIVDTRFSATKLVFQHLIKGNDAAGVAQVKEYNDLVRIVDLLDVGDRNSDVFLKNVTLISELSSFFSSAGVSAFRRRFMQKKNLVWNEVERAGIATVDKFRQDLLRRLNPIEVQASNGLFNYAIVFASDYQSDIPEYVMRTRPGIALIFIIDMNDARFSLRRNANNPFGADLDLAKIAENYDGGGHPFAAGFEAANHEQAIKYIEEIINGRIRTLTS